MNYTLHQLQIFLEVVRQKSITRAAEEMHMTQPALSIQLKNFQMQFDVPLTELIGKKLYITDFGQSIAEIAENVLKEADAIKYKTKDYRGLLTGKLRISSASTGKYVIPYFLNGFMRKYPGIDLNLDVSNKSIVVKNLQNNEIDFALVSLLPQNVVVEEELLLENKLYLVGNIPEIQKNRPLIFREPGSATRGAMDQYFSKYSDRKSLELTSNEAVKQAVIAGLGYSIIPLIGIKNELLNEQLHIIPSKGLPILTYWRLVWLKKKKLSPVAKAYLEYIRAEKEKIMTDSFQWYTDYS
ncbi:MAG: LysR substrate-binding domain-containing protein [Bacteroidota bacterium]